MSTSDSKDDLAHIISALQELVGIVKNQQSILAQKSFHLLQETVQRRQELVEQISDFWGKEANGLEHAEVEIRNQIRELMNEFIKNDKLVQVLMTYHMEGILIELARKSNQNFAVEQYKQVERLTDVVARTFKGDSRYFNGDY